MLRDLILGWAKTLVAAHYRVVPIGAPGAGSGPVVVVSNHTNGLVDAVVLIRASGRPLRFLAKQELMHTPVLGSLARRAGAIPVYRKKDNVPTSWNDGAFDAIHASLAQGAAIGVFPEGTSHLDAPIRPLKTGAARIALGAEASGRWRVGVRIYPVGIHYEDRESLGSRVLAIVGEPFEVQEYGTHYRDAPWDASLELTGAIHQALQGVRVELPEYDAAPLIALVLDELEAGTLSSADAPTRLHALVNGWRARLEADEAGGRAQMDRLRTLERARRAGATQLALFVLRWFALFVWGVPLLAAQLVRRALPLSVDKCATVTCLVASLLLPAWLVLAPWVVGALAGAAWGWTTLLLLLASAGVGWWSARATWSHPLPQRAAEERAQIANELVADARAAAT